VSPVLYSRLATSHRSATRILTVTSTYSLTQIQVCNRDPSIAIQTVMRPDTSVHVLAHSCNHCSSVIPGTEYTMEFSVVLSRGRSAIPSSGQLEPFSDSNSNSNRKDITHSTNMTCIVSMGSAKGSLIGLLSARVPNFWVGSDCSSDHEPNRFNRSYHTKSCTSAIGPVLQPKSHHCNISSLPPIKYLNPDHIMT